MAIIVGGLPLGVLAGGSLFIGERPEPFPGGTLASGGIPNLVGSTSIPAVHGVKVGGGAVVL